MKKEKSGTCQKKIPDLAHRIVYEDNHLLVINKWSSEIVQSDKTGDLPLCEQAKSFLKTKYQKPGQVFCGVVHRLDRPVSGLVLFAKTGKALARLNKLLQERQIRKFYWALTRQAPPQDAGILEGFLTRNKRLNKSFFSPTESPEALSASLAFKVLHRFDRLTLLEIELFTGRHHQIRASLAFLKCPVAGDVKYGDRRALRDQSIALHARRLELVHPVSGERLLLEGPCPSGGIWESVGLCNEGDPY
ncbi:MAG: RluA family pseudouridine synthase [Flavobacteriales bacterium]|nr:RluA family pseudouridine synthase [Flavobacteriales bacterium]MCX7649697.1 RluA family pseudouridine synthase [Flavobacteriales bacterium]MDW8432883.1 RluA family pseudouridine synthase [Flavobacteriales bacterium]